jgi:hypothetical protein
MNDTQTPIDLIWKISPDGCHHNRAKLTRELALPRGAVGEAFACIGNYGIAIMYSRDDNESVLETNLTLEADWESIVSQLGGLNDEDTDYLVRVALQAAMDRGLLQRWNEKRRGS